MGEVHQSWPEMEEINKTLIKSYRVNKSLRPVAVTVDETVQKVKSPPGHLINVFATF